MEYKINIQKLDYIPTYNTYEKVVSKVYWNYEATKGTISTGIGGSTELTSIDLETAATTSFTGLTGLSATHPISKVSLFRNGAKLRAGTDYTITTAGAINIITEAGDVGVNDFNLYATDILEVHWIK